jgi:GDPmannose 4,6-dehydratase
MARVLITGCMGQDGRFLSRKLSESGDFVVGTDVVGGNGSYGGLVYRRCDVTDFGSLCSLIEEFGFEEIHHLAALADPKLALSDPHGMAEVNVMGTLSVLRAASIAGSDVKVLLVSSDSAFGIAGRIQDEKTPLAPTDLYGVTKAACLMLGDAYRNMGMRVSCAIPFNHSSPIQAGNFLLPKVVRGVCRVLEGVRSGASPAPIVLNSRYDRRDFLDAEDVADAFMTIMRKCPPGRYVVGSGVSHTVEEIAARAFEVIGEEFFGGLRADYRDFVVFASEGSDGSWPCGDSSLLRSYGWSPKFGLRELILKIAGGIIRRVRKKV